MMNKLLLVDGSSLLTKSFHGNTPPEYQKAKTEEQYEAAVKKLLKTKSGEYVNGVYTMMKTLMRLIEKHKPKYLCVAWDLSRDTWRRDFYPLYKANRDATRPELKSQFATAQRVLEAMKISQYVIPKFEADDIVGTLAERHKDEVPVIILTGDQDAIQLVDDRVSMWYTTKKAADMYKQVGLNASDVGIGDNIFELTPMYVEEFYGIRPIQIIDFKAIDGDKSDNIPGIKGVGEKTIIPLLQEFGTLEDIYDFLETNDDDEIKDMIKSLGIAKNPTKNMLKVKEADDVSEEVVGKEAAFMSKRLATIERNMPHLKDVTLSELELHIDEAGKERVFEELEFKSLLQVAKQKSA